MQVFILIMIIKMTITKILNVLINFRYILFNGIQINIFEHLCLSFNFNSTSSFINETIELLYIVRDPRASKSATDATVKWCIFSVASQVAFAEIISRF